jgi:Uma2 family endonuclease
MTIAKLPTRKTAEPPESPQHLVMDDVDWEFYEQVLEQVGNSRLRVVYDQGRLEIMAPSSFHETVKTIVARIIETYALAADIPIVGWGSTTFRDKALARGLEPDECYYVAHVAAMEGKRTWDPRVDPPPDLAIEVDISQYLLDRPSIYAALGVPEIWQYKVNQIIYTTRNRQGKYIAKEKSLAFPKFLPADLNRFLQMAQKGSQHETMKRVAEYGRGHQ